MTFGVVVFTYEPFGDWILEIVPVPGTEHFLGTFYLFLIKPVFYLPWLLILLIIHHTSRAHAPLTTM